MHRSPRGRLRAASLDQYYTQRPIARRCWKKLEQVSHRLGFSLSQSLVIEPSAGGGAFLDTAPAGVTCRGFDIDPAPARPDIRALDFLADPLPRMRGPQAGCARVVVGNPPFGKKSALALAFIHRAFQEARADIVAFIVPVQFRKWSAQRHVGESARLLVDMDLPEQAFEFQGKPYGVRCCFQIWAAPGVSLPPRFPDLRLRVRPPTQHPDFTAYQYNRMPGSDKVFALDWDFAVPRQGYCDYTTKVYRPSDCDRRKQWILFKAHSPQALSRLNRLDFAAMARTNAAVPGFGKTEVVRAYVEAMAPQRASHGGRKARGNFTRRSPRYPCLIHPQVRNVSGHGSNTMAKATASITKGTCAKTSAVRGLMTPAIEGRFDTGPAPARREPLQSSLAQATSVKGNKKVGFDRTVGEETYLTPKYIIDAVGPFDLDPATPERGMPWRTAKRMLKPSHDGLATAWPKSDFVWHNPPYGNICGAWMEKAAAHGNGITLIFARTDTEAFDEHLWRHPNTTAIFFFRGRVKFHDVHGNEVGSAGAPSVLVAYGMKARGRLIAAVKAGKLYGRIHLLGADQAEVWQLGRKPRRMAKSNGMKKVA